MTDKPDDTQPNAGTNPQVSDAEDRPTVQESPKDFIHRVDKKFEKDGSVLEETLRVIRNNGATDGFGYAIEDMKKQRSKFKDEIIDINVNVEDFPGIFGQFVKYIYGKALPPKKTIKLSESQLKEFLYRIEDKDRAIMETLYGKGYGLDKTIKKLGGKHKDYQDLELQFDKTCRSYERAEKEVEEFNALYKECLEQLQLNQQDPQNRASLYEKKVKLAFYLGESERASQEIERYYRQLKSKRASLKAEIDGFTNTHVLLEEFAEQIREGLSQHPYINKTDVSLDEIIGQMPSIKGTLEKHYQIIGICAENYQREMVNLAKLISDRPSISPPEIPELQNPYADVHKERERRREESAKEIRMYLHGQGTLSDKLN